MGEKRETKLLVGFFRPVCTFHILFLCPHIFLDHFLSIAGFG
jgi:hypothetical protein